MADFPRARHAFAHEVAPSHARAEPLYRADVAGELYAGTNQGVTRGALNLLRRARCGAKWRSRWR